MDNIIVINKDKDYTSRDVVNVIGKIFNTKKVGHTGTLDPLATGVLIVCMNKALKVVDLITASDKEYIAKVVLGIDTDTLDITGNIINECRTNVNVDMVKSVLNSFIGKSIQEVPKYSAVKVNGKKLYEYARNGIDVELPKREIQIFDIELISDIDIVDGHQEFSFKVKVSKGTYIRSLIRDIGIKLGCFACMKELTRTKQGKFSIDKSYTLNDIKNGNYKLLNIKDVIDIEKVVVSDDMLFKIKNGMILDKFFISDKALILDNNGNEIGIYKTYDKDSKKVKPDKIF
ncbi:MAG: tRNA pseudouridine(55) synthase TruB [Bacilli bacterium]|nr:tRNA pseudouridine(55) synthase TruB [Bacilli bacterium]